MPETIYRTARKPLHPGQMRSKTWRYLIPPADDNDKVWFERCAKYWKRQERLFGFVLEPKIAMIVAWEDGAVTTFARISRILPGPRSPHVVLPEGFEA